MRKCIFIFTLLFFIIVNSKSQTNKGDFLLGGGASIGFSSEDFHFSLNPNVGYFFTKKSCLGGVMPIIFMGSGNYYIGLSPFYRYYLGNSDKSQFFVLTQINIIKKSSNIGIANQGLITLGIGNVWFVHENLGLEAKLVGDISEDNFNIEIRFGFQIYLQKNNKKQKEI